MKQTIALLACLLTGGMLQAQAVPMALEDWKTTQGTQNFFYKNVTKTDASGNVYVAGATMNNGFPDMLVAKYNAAGNLQWIRQMAGTAPNGVDAIAGMYVTGTDVYVTGAVSNNSVTPETDCITMKLSGSTGSVLWSATYTGAAGGHDAGKDVTLDGSGNVYVSGASYNSSFNTDYLVLKYNSSGVQQWASGWDYTGADDGAYKIALSGTNVNVTGAVTTTTPGTYKMSTIKLAQASGSITAANTSTAVTTSSVEAVTDMALDGSGNVILVGSQYTGGQHDFYVQKLNASTLSSVFVYTWDGGSSLDDYAKAVTTDASGNVFVAGFSSTSSLGRELTLIKLNSSGTHQWTQTSGFGGDDEAADLVTDASGDVYVTGYNSVSPTNKDYYTAKYNTSGTKVWGISLPGKGSLNDYATNLTLDSLNNVVVTGQNETGIGSFQFVTVRYVQRDVVVPTDINTEEPSDHFWYYRNEGQLRDINDSLVKGVLFHTDNTSPNILIHKNKMSFVFAKMDTIIATVDTIQRLEMSLKGANAQTKAFPLETQEYAISYFMGQNRDFTGLHGNRKLITPDIYPNIDLIYSSNGNGIKYYYIVKPGGNPANIQVQFDGLANYNLNPITNELTISTNCGAISFAKPMAYQLSTSNTPIAITGWTPDWQNGGSTGSYDFSIGAYTSSLTLVIMVDRGPFNPAIAAADNLTWNTYQGGNMDEYCRDLRVDRSGNIYALNESWSGTFFMTSTSSYGTAQTNKAGTQIMKYDMDGKPLKQIYITTATGGTFPKGLTILNNSHIVVVGSSAPQGLSVPIGGNPSGALTSNVGPGWIMKIDPTLSNGLLWRTYYPGGIIQDVDNKLNGDIYICAVSNTNTAQVWPQTGALNVSTVSSFSSEMVAKFNSNGVPLWSSYIGVYPMSGYIGYSRIKVDTARNEFYVFGMNNSGTTDWIGYNHYGTYLRNTNIGLNPDSYIKKFNQADSMKVSTFIGGNNYDQIADLAFLANGDLCFVGYTNSTDTVNIIKNPYDGSYVSTKRNNSNDKGWVLKFDSTFNWKYGTLYGDSARTTQFRSVSTDVTNSNIMMAGYTEGMPGVGPGNLYYKNCETQGDGAFVSMDASNQVTWATAMGSAALNDMVDAAAYNPKNQNWDFAGTTQSSNNYPVRSYPNSYLQWSNYAAGHSENVTGRFGAIVPVVGIQETTKPVSGNDISLYPNPAQNSTNLYFRLGLEGRVKITISNAIGQVIELRQLNNIEPNTTLNITTNSWAEGLYFVNIQNEKQSESIKFINFK